MVKYILFCDTDRWYGRFLKKGFGHCYTATYHDGVWKVSEIINGLLFYREIKSNKFLPGYIGKMLGHLYIECPSGKSKRCDGFSNNCVSTSKFLLGIDAPMVWTPLQLYREILRLWDLQAPDYPVY